jgi:hypothetical protein
VTLLRPADNSVRVAVLGADWHQIKLGNRPHAIHFAQLEDDAGLVAWDDGDAVKVRSWDRAGTLGPARAVLTGVETLWEGDTSAAGWHLSADRAGTVVIAAPGLATDGVYATVRDPGRDFSAPQKLLAPSTPPTPQPGLTVSPVAPDGTVIVSGGAHSEGPRCSRATRPAPRCAPAARRSSVRPSRPPRPPIPRPGRPTTPRASASRMTSCPCAGATQGCRSPKVFTWSSGEQGFRRNFDTSYIAPRVYLQSAASSGGVLRLSVFRTACHVGGATLEPYEVGVARLRAPRAAVTRVRISLTARNARGHTTRLSKTLRRSGLEGGRRVWRVTR